MNIFWKIVGTLLLAWVAWDIYYEYTMVWDIVHKEDDPLLYWTAVSAWALLGISCFFSWESS